MCHPYFRMAVQKIRKQIGEVISLSAFYATAPWGFSSDNIFLNDEKVIYFGDTARVPYGSKSKETVTRFSRQIVRFLQSKQVKAIVVACNTASAYALNDLEREIDIPIIGVVKPGAKVAAEVTRNGQVGVIATEGTIVSLQVSFSFLQHLLC